MKELRGFSLAARERVRHMARLSQSAIADIMTSSYRALRRSQTEKLATLGSMNVTLSRDLLLFHRS